MRRVMAIAVLLGLAQLSVALSGVPCAAAQQVVDRIVAVIEGDLITLSEIRELGRFEQLMGGPGASGSIVRSSDEVLLRRLVEQWIVAAEAAAARFPKPAAVEVDSEIARLQGRFGSQDAYQARLRELELTPAVVRRLIERQIYLARYLDYKFRPAAQIEPAQIEKYYREELAAQLAARGETLPPLDKVQDPIHELLVQRDISERAARWLEESKSRLKIEVRLGEAPK